MSGTISPTFKESVRDLNALYDWSLQVDELERDIRERCFADYVAWKIPFPASRTENNQVHRSIRSFCVERLICKLTCLASLAQKLDEQTEILRFYCIVSEPNLWTSEVGIIFSEKKWEKLLYRSVEMPGYFEKTVQTGRTLFEAFGVLRPSNVTHMHMSHMIEDRDEEISFQGGLHALWIDHSQNPPPQAMTGP